MAGGGFNSRGPIAARSSRRRSVMVLSQREALATHARRQRIHQVDDVAGIARFHGRSYRLAPALLGSPARRVRFRSGLQVFPL